MDPVACRKYLDCIRYDLGEDKREALARFFHQLIEMGEAATGCLPLRIHAMDERD